MMRKKKNSKVKELKVETLKGKENAFKIYKRAYKKKKKKT